MKDEKKIVAYVRQRNEATVVDSWQGLQNTLIIDEAVVECLKYLQARFSVRDGHFEHLI